MFELSWQPPYDWQWMFGFLQARAVTRIERFEAGSYTRSFEYLGHHGLITMTPDTSRNVLGVTLSDDLLAVAEPCLARVSRLLDLACSPRMILHKLGALAEPRPGLRLPGSMDAFEQGVRAILGQLVSVSMAAKLTGKVVEAYGEPLTDFPDFLLFPRPEQLAQADPLQLKALGMPLKRAQALIYLAQAALSGALPTRAPTDIEQGMKTLQSFPGIGRWTANYFALRGWQATDVFLPDDYLIKQRFPGMTPAQIRRYAERWHPWRSYALLHIWYTDDWMP